VSPIAPALASTAVVLAAVALAACGKGGATTTIVQRAGPSGGGASGGARTTPAPKERAPAPTAARAQAFARAVNLTAADVPGFTATAKHSPGTASERRLEHEMLACAGLSGAPAKAIFEEGSKSFQLKRSVIQLSVSSEVTVEPSAASALRALAAIRSSHVRGCFSRYLERIFRGRHVGGASTGQVTIQAGTPPAPGTSGGFGWRITASFDVRGIRVPLYLDILGFVVGPSEVTLLSSSVLRPFPADAQQHLFTLLLARARANRP
jgi:hypothetical protein